MSDTAADRTVLDRIQRLATEEEQLYGQRALSDADRDRLARVKVELDQCWDLLRQRRARRDAGHNPEEAHVRSADEVERYQG